MQEEIEIWKDIPGYEGLYKCSNTGIIKRMPRSHYNQFGAKISYKEKILKHCFDKDKYHLVTLYKNKKPIQYHVHTLVAITYCEKIEGSKRVLYIDKNYDNINYTNLLWSDGFKPLNKVKGIEYIYRKDINIFINSFRGITNCVIYQIKNLVNSNLYIGSAKNLSKRFHKHLRELETNTHHCVHLQRAWNKYGGGNFIVSVIESCSLEEQYIREQYYIDTLRPVYNSSKTATGGSGGILSDKGRKSLQENGRNSWNKLTEDEKIKRKEYLRNLKLGNKPSLETRQKMSIGIKAARAWENPKRIEAVIKSNKEKHSMPVQKLTLDHILVEEYYSIKEALYSCGYKYSRKLTECLQGKREEAYGYIWKLKNI